MEHWILQVLWTGSDFKQLGFKGTGGGFTATEVS